VRHSGAGTCRLRVDVGEQAVRLELADDGRGSAAVDPGGGLTGIRHRLAEVDGHLVVTSRGDGFTLAATVPVRAAEAGGVERVAEQR